MTETLCQPSPIQIRNVGATNHRAIKSAATCAGVTMNAMLRPSVKQIIESYPEYMRNEPAPNTPGVKIHLSGVPASQKQQLENIASHVGVDVSALFKTDLARPDLHKKKTGTNG